MPNIEDCEFTQEQLEQLGNIEKDLLIRSKRPPQGTWSKPRGNQRNIIPFTEHPALSTNLCLRMRNASPADFFQLMVPDSLFQEIADCTNTFATNKIARSEETSPFARLRKRFPIYLGKIKKFFGLILLMGFMKLPRSDDSILVPTEQILRWYRKLAIDIILNIAMENALTLFKSVNENNIQMVDFRRGVLMKLCEAPQTDAPVERPKRVKHTLVGETIKIYHINTLGT
ncbi:unnamed protein product [Leptidea sinapis]|uniref:PiggyBac transposable element-derived protein domain-containing protein n=1 Tax=Leptidea sinapis TaxID=189913 RepID=A0A5E4QNS2_9NEOP|nr:unnamed protein product [Leptidea sinapis]